MLLSILTLVFNLLSDYCFYSIGWHISCQMSGTSDKGIISRKQGEVATAHIKSIEILFIIFARNDDFTHIINIDFIVSTRVILLRSPKLLTPSRILSAGNGTVKLPNA